MIEYWRLFLIFGFLGWLIDTAYRSYIDKKYAPGTWLPCFGISYAIAGILVTTVFRYVPASAIVQIIIATLLSTLLELLGGILALAVLKRRLWDYRAHPYNFLGHIEVRHALYWVFIISCMRLVYHFVQF